MTFSHGAPPRHERRRHRGLGEDRCRLTWQVAYTPTGTFAAIHFGIRPVLALSFRTYMRGLRKYCRRLKSTS